MSASDNLNPQQFNVHEFRHNEWEYSGAGRVSSSVYNTREKAEAAATKPQHPSKRTNTTRPKGDWQHLWGAL